MKFKKADIAVFFAFVVIALVLTLERGSGDQGAIVYVNNAPVLKINDIYEDKQYDVVGKNITILCSKSRGVCVLSSDCDDKVCLNTGYIAKQGQTIVCLPNRLMVKITTSDDEIDGVV